VIRVVLVAVLAVAVAAVAVPAVERGRVDRTATALDAAADRLDRTARLLVARDDPTGVGVGGARRVLTLELPVRGPGAAAVERFALDGRDGAAGPGGWVRYRVAGGETRRVRVTADLRTPDGPVVLRDGGRHRLVLRLVARPDAPPAVVVGRARAQVSGRDQRVRVTPHRTVDGRDGAGGGGLPV
jgi:hypothetical protein